ncbi:MAG TPA: hypothetical protein VEQ85_14215 [Lacipirellulaceae bacterium]|nr:hypothetical protein [Lacipirellulaceae bacterium]
MVSTTRVLLSVRIKSYPALFRPIALLREGGKKRCVRRTTDLVIEGYWRCGNHFAVYAFLVAQGKHVDVAHHFHAPAQLMLAARWGVPAVLLIREPVEAVASATVFLMREDPRPLLAFYNAFHERLLDYVDRLVVSDFPITVGDFGAVIEAVNAKYHTHYLPLEGTPEQRAEIDRRIREEHQQNMGAVATTLPLPSATKTHLKQRVLQRLERPECAALLDQARRHYEALRVYSVAARRPAETAL